MIEIQLLKYDLNSVVVEQYNILGRILRLQTISREIKDQNSQLEGKAPQVVGRVSVSVQGSLGKASSGYDKALPWT